MPPPDESASAPVPASGPVGADAAPDSPPGRSGVAAVGFTAAFAFLLASFPAQNPDLWAHLAAGRDLAAGQLDAATRHWTADGRTTAGWLYTLGVYLLYSVVGGPGLVLAKAAAVGLLGVVLVRLSRARDGWLIPVFCTGLAVLAMSPGAQLRPATVSYLFLAVALWLVWRREAAGRVSWPLVLLFLVWANTDRWFVLGLAVVGLTWLGQALDAPGTDRARIVGRRLGALALLAAVCALNPGHLRAFTLALGAVRSGPGGASPVSPFQGVSLDDVGQSPAELAYFPLLALGVVSFALARPQWRWGRVLPWVGLAALSAVQARAVPFFAVVAGPVLAWNLQDFFARRAGAAGVLPRFVRRAVPVAAGLVGLVFLAAAWPGWLGAAPFGPRQWTIDTPPALRRGGEAVARGHADGRFRPDGRGLHLSPETLFAFAWFCPAERPVHDPALAGAALGDPVGGPAGLRAAGVDHLVVYDPDRGRLTAALRRLLADPDQFPLLLSEGDLAVFGWRDPAARVTAAPPTRPDFDRRALNPGPGEKAPPARPAGSGEEPRWWEAFWKPAPGRSLDRDTAVFHVLLADVAAGTADRRHLADWEASQVAGLVGAAAAGPGPGGLSDTRTRLVFFRPPLGNRPGVSPDPLGGVAFAYQRVFVEARNDAPMGALYLAVRAARRALAANPRDAIALAALGEAYRLLAHHTRERAWGRRLAEVAQLRRVQAAAALAEAAALAPDLAQPHLGLATLFEEAGYLDLTLRHYRAYLAAVRRAGPPPGADAAQFGTQVDAVEQRLARLADLVEQQEREHAREAADLRVLDRAVLARDRGLAGRALDILTRSDISAFGASGLALELELLLRVGRVRDVREWTGEEHREALGAMYHWLRAQALAAGGDYELAQAECVQLAAESSRTEGGARAVMAALAAQAVLDGQTLVGGPASVLGRALPRAEFRSQLARLALDLQREADATVLRGLIALEAGEVEEAEVAFRLALATWTDAEAAAAGRGLDFAARPVAQDCLHWIESGRGP